MILLEYKKLKEAGIRGSRMVFARHISHRLGYKLDKTNNSNSFVLKVLREENPEDKASTIVL